MGGYDDGLSIFGKVAGLSSAGYIDLVRIGQAMRIIVGSVQHLVK